MVNNDGNTYSYIPGGQVSGAEFCASCRGGNQEHIDIGRVLSKLDRLLAEKDFAAVKNHLEYWRREAEALGDSPAKLTLTNELMGYSRQYGEKEAALAYAEEGIRLAENDPEFSGTSFMGITWLNAATVYKTYGMSEKALELYRKAETVFKEKLDPGDHRIAALYNNMGLALADLERFTEARECYEKALSIGDAEAGELAPDRAVTLLNLADLLVYERGTVNEGAPCFGPEDEAEGERLLDLAFHTLTGKNVPRDDYFVYVCDKCAKVFGDYGFFLYRNELQEAAGEVINKRVKAD